MAKEVEVRVTSVFQCGKETLAQEYTNKWVELINLLEKSEGFSHES